MITINPILTERMLCEPDAGFTNLELVRIAGALKMRDVIRLVDGEITRLDAMLLGSHSEASRERTRAFRSIMAGLKLDLEKLMPANVEFSEPVEEAQSK